MMVRTFTPTLMLVLVGALPPAGASGPQDRGAGTSTAPERVLTGADALGDWTTDAPGVRRKITVDDLAPPYDTRSADNFPRLVPRPRDAWPRAPQGFTVGVV